MCIYIYIWQCLFCSGAPMGVIKFTTEHFSKSYVYINQGVRVPSKGKPFFKIWLFTRIDVFDRNQGLWVPSKGKPFLKIRLFTRIIVFDRNQGLRVPSKGKSFLKIRLFLQNQCFWVCICHGMFRGTPSLRKTVDGHKIDTAIYIYIYMYIYIYT